jgi:hypothetical protein
MITARSVLRRAVAALLVAAGFAAVSVSAAPGRIELTDGSVIMGEVVDIRGGKVTLKTAFSKKLVIDEGLVKSLDSGEQVELMLDDARVVEVEQLAINEGQLTLDSGEKIALSQVDVANPAPWEKGEGYHWVGNSGAGLTLQRGNTENDQLDLALNTTFTSTRDRFTIRANVEQDDTYQNVTTTAADGSVTTRTVKTPTADNWRIVGKYDYFLADPDSYVGANFSAESDSLSGIDLRTYAGPYFGRKLIKESWLTLDGELGLSYVSTDFAAEEDDEYTGVGWELNGESKILGPDTRLYLIHSGIMDVSDTSRAIINTTMGLGFPLFMGLEGAAEIRLDYDGGAAEGAENMDQTMSLRIGYSW